MQKKDEITEESKTPAKVKQIRQQQLVHSSGHQTHRNPTTVGKSVDISAKEVKRSCSRGWIRSLFCCLSASQKGLSRKESSGLIESKGNKLKRKIVPSRRFQTGPNGHNQLRESSTSSVIERIENRSISDEQSREDATNLLLKNDVPRMVTKET